MNIVHCKADHRLHCMYSFERKNIPALKIRGSNESWSYFETNWCHTFTIINHKKTFYTYLDPYLNYKKPLVDGESTLITAIQHIVLYFKNCIAKAVHSLAWVVYMLLASIREYLKFLPPPLFPPPPPINNDRSLSAGILFRSKL